MLEFPTCTPLADPRFEEFNVILGGLLLESIFAGLKVNELYKMFPLFFGV